MPDHKQVAQAAARAHQIRAQLAELQAELQALEAQATQWHTVMADKLAEEDYVDANGQVARAGSRDFGIRASHVMLDERRVLLHGGTGRVTLTVLDGSPLLCSPNRGRDETTIEVGESKEFRGMLWARSLSSTSSVSMVHVDEEIVPPSRENAQFPLLTADGWVHA